MFKGGILCWESCPNCDEPLSEPIGVDDDWRCRACGEWGTRGVGKYDMTLAAYRARQEQLIPEQRLRNVANLVLRQTAPARPALSNGRGREASYVASKAEIAQAARQLAGMVLDYLAGELQPTPAPTDDLPF